MQKSRAVFVPRKRYHVLVESGDIMLKKKIAELLRYYRELKRAETGERERLTIVRSRKKRSIEINHFVREFLETTEDYDKALGTSELAKVLHLYYFERKTETSVALRAYLSESSVKRMKEIIVTDVMLLCAAKNLLTYEQILHKYFRLKNVHMQRRGIRKEETQKYAGEVGFERRVKRRTESLRFSRKREKGGSYPYR